MKIKHKIKNMNLLLYIFIIFFCLFSFLSVIPTFVYAEDKEYSNVLDDLTKDENFNIEDYPTKDKDYSLQVIHIAESVDWELFVYVYQPSADLYNIKASSITMSTVVNGLNFITYSLRYINSNGTLFKYVVEGFEVSRDFERVYDVTSIYRPFDKEIDEEIEGQIINEVNYNVSKIWTYTINDEGIVLDIQDTDTIRVTDKYVGFIRYQDGNWWKLWGESACDRHFIAFSTDKDIDRLMEADVYYQSQSAHFRDYLSILYKDSWTFGDPEEGYKYLTYKDTGGYEGLGGIDWSRIQTIDEFVDTVNVSWVYTCGILDFEVETKISEEGWNDVKDKQWVLSFLETSYEVKKSVHEENYYSTRVSNVSILRLKFETDGVIYDLGVIDNKQSGDGIPDSDNSINASLADWVEAIIAIVTLMLLLMLIVFLWPFISPVLSVIIKFLLNCLKYIFKGIWWVITAPFSIFDD